MGICKSENAKLYYAATQSGPWTEITNVKDASWSVETVEADVSTRANAGWKARVAIQKDLTFEWGMVWDDNDQAFTAIREAWFEGTPIAIRMLDKEEGQGPQADCMIVKFNQEQGLDDILRVTITAKPTYSNDPPSWQG